MTDILWNAFVGVRHIGSTADATQAQEWVALGFRVVPFSLSDGEPQLVCSPESEA